MEQQFEMQAIKLRNEQDQAKLDLSEKNERLKIDGSMEIAQKRDQLSERQAVRDRELSEYKEQTKVEVDKIRAEAAALTTKLEFDRQRALETLRLEAEETAAQLEAKTALKVATDEGAAKTTLAAAEEKSNALLLKARQLELTEKQLGVYAALANNADVLVSDTHDKDVNMMLLADNVLHTSDAASAETTHGGMMANLNMLRLASNAYGLRQDTYIPATGGGARPLD